MISPVSVFLLASALVQTAPPSNAPAPAQSAAENTEAASVANGARRPPVLLSQVSPEYTEQARKKKISGDVQVSAIVDENGMPQDVTVVHGLGLGLDEKAVQAVRQYRFRPATRGGVPVSTKIFIDVNFQIF